MDMKYFIYRNGAQEGPFNMEELKEKSITSDTMVWHEGMADWEPAWQVAELKEMLYGKHEVENDADTTPQPPKFNGDTNNADETPTQTIADNPENKEAAEEVTLETAVRKKSHSGAWIALIVVVGLLMVLTATCPTKQQHRDTIKDSVASALTKSFLTEDGLLGAIYKIAQEQLFGSAIDRVVDNSLTYHNYVVFSKCDIDIEGESKPVSYGVLGHVFTVKEQDITDYINENSPLKKLMNNDFFNIQDDSDADDYKDNDNANDDDSVTDGEMNDDDGMGELSEDLLDAMTDIVKKQVNNRSDSTTGSGIGKIIDGIVDVIKGQTK